MSKSIYSKRQWEWMLERHREGYSYKAIADFVGFSIPGVQVKLSRMEKRVLPPLESRKEEFNKLMDSDLNSCNGGETNGS